MNTETPQSDTPETDAFAYKVHEGHCLPSCDSYDHDPKCPVANGEGLIADFARTLERQRNALRAFAQEIMRAHPDGGIDGGDLQEIATRHGLLAETVATESCGEGCQCAMYADEWPTRCFRPTALLTGEQP